MSLINKLVNDKYKIIFLFAFILIIIFYYFNVLLPLENKIYDFLLLIKHLINPVDINDILIVAIDDKTLNILGDWPLPRGYYARIINILENAGAEAVGMDLIFADYSLTAEDKKLEEALKSYDNIIIPVVAKLNIIRKLHKDKLSINNFILPVDIYADNAQLGHINFIPDRDGIIRSLPYPFEHKDKEYFPFAREIAKSPDFYQDDSYLINFPGPPGTIPAVSFIDVLQNEYKPDFFQDKYIIIGSMGTGLGDKYMTSFSRYGYLTGVELLAQNLHNIINKSYIKKISFGGNILILITIVIFLYVLFSHVSPLKAFFILMCFNIVYLAAALYLFYYKNILLYISAPVISTFIIFGISLIYWYYSSESHKKMLVKSFSRYLSPRVTEKLQKDPEKIELGGESIFVTIMFVDIRNFTVYTEKKSPKEITDILNKFYYQVINILFKYDGTLDKYLGDGLMAFYGAPLLSNNHREQAFLTAREILEFIDKSNFNFEVGIGINSGQVIAGNVGLKSRMNYTIIGDAVNQAAKYVENARPGEIVMGSSTYNGLNINYQKFNWKKDNYRHYEVYKLSL